MRTLARASDELRASALANLVVGDTALLVGAARADHPGRTIVWFALANLALAVIWATVGPSGRLRRQAPRAAAPPAGAVVEDAAATRRRVIVGLAPIGVALAVLVVLAPESAAILAGVPAGIGSGDLWTGGWLRRYERERRDELLREAPRTAFSGGARETYTRPIEDVIEAT